MSPTPEKPSLAIDARLINVSGIGTVCQNTIPLLLDDFRVIVLGVPSELNRFEWAAKCIIIPFTKKIYSLAEQLQFFFKVPACDYFLSPHYNIPLLPIKANKRIVIIHDVNHIALKADLNQFKQIYARLVISSALRFSDKVITVSDFSRSEIQKYFHPVNKNIYTIKLGVDKKIYRLYESTSKEQLRRKYQLPGQFLLYVGNVKPHKNLQLLIKAYKIAKEEGKLRNYKLVIVGKKDGFITEDNTVLSLISDFNLEDDVIFTGYVEQEELPLFYSLADLFIFPSLYEGFGLPPIEAMACGCPVLVSEVSSLPEVCKNAAIYFNPLDEYQLAHKITELLQNEPLRNHLSAKGLDLVKEYDWQQTANEIKQIIKL